MTAYEKILATASLLSFPIKPVSYSNKNIPPYSTMPRAKFINDEIAVSAFDISKIALGDSARANTRFKGITGEIEEFTLFRTDTSNGQEYKDVRHVETDVNFDPNKEVVLRGDSERTYSK